MNRRDFLQTTALAGFALAARGRAADKRWRVAVIGHTGRGDYGHGLDTMWLKLPETEVVAVADADAKGLAKAQTKLPGAKPFADYREMLAQTTPEIVAIAPRHVDQHRDMALAAIEAGVRGIYMEKPFCPTPAEADEIVAACQRHGVKLAVAHRNRYHPALPMVERLVREGRIGQLLEMRGRGKEDARGGVQDLWVLGSHVFNLMNFFGGRPLACSATLLQDGRPATRADVHDGAEGIGPIAGNALHARFEMERSVPAYFDSIAKAGVAEANFGLQLIGTQGIIDLRIDVHPIAHLVPGNPFMPTQEPRPWIPISSAGAGEPEPIADCGSQVAGHLFAARDLLTAISEDRPALCDAEAGRTTIEMICAVLESHRLDSQRVPLPLKMRQDSLTLLEA